MLLKPTKQSFESVSLSILAHHSLGVVMPRCIAVDIAATAITGRREVKRRQQIPLTARNRLRARSLMATAEFYELIGRPAPAPEPLFQAVAKGKAWHIIEIATGKTKGFRFRHRAAMDFMDEMKLGEASKRAG